MEEVGDINLSGREVGSDTAPHNLIDKEGKVSRLHRVRDSSKDEYMRDDVEYDAWEGVWDLCIRE